MNVPPVTTASAPATLPASDSTTPSLFKCVIGLSLLAALVPTIWPELDLMGASLFAGPQAPFSRLGWWWLQPVNDYVPTVFRWLLLASAVAWLLSFALKRFASARGLLAFFLVAGILGPGAVVNWGFKDNWQRARPYQVEYFGGTQKFTRAGVITDQCDANCSFVSGHVSCGIFFAALALIHRRRQVQWTLFGVSSGLLIGVARMSDHAHWLSDVLWAFPITLGASWLVWRALHWLYSKPWRTVG